MVQGFLVGFGLAYITLQILGRIKVTKINGWTTMFRCGEPGTASCPGLRAPLFSRPDKRTTGGHVLDHGRR